MSRDCVPDPTAALPLTPAGFAAQTGVSRETLTKLESYAALISAWSGRMNLIAASTLPDLWRRHFLDSAQLLPLVPAAATSLVDIGSGAGFPGLVLAILLDGRPGFRATLIDSVQKKCRFLEAVIAATGAPATALWSRAEAVPAAKADLVTARACAPLPELLGLIRPFLKDSGVALLPKGEGAPGELAAARRVWTFGYDLVKSETRSDSHIVVVRPPLVPR